MNPAEGVTQSGGRYVQAHGLNLYYVESGSGRPLSYALYADSRTVRSLVQRSLLQVDVASSIAEPPT